MLSAEQKDEYKAIASRLNQERHQEGFTDDEHVKEQLCEEAQRQILRIMVQLQKRTEIESFAVFGSKKLIDTFQKSHIVATSKDMSNLP